MNDLKVQALGIRVLLALGMLLVMAVASVDTPTSVSAHGGDVDQIHACINDTNAEVLIVHPGPGNADIDCVNAPWPLGAGWSPLDFTDTQLSESQVDAFVSSGPIDLAQSSTLNGLVILTGNGSANKIAAFGGSSTQLFDSVIFQDALDNIGIGTVTPNEQFEITGNFRLPATTATTGIIMSDGNRLIHSFGTNNFFAGVNAGNLATAGSGANTGVGSSALRSNTTGCCNTATGDDSLLPNTTGNSNTAAGSASLQNNTGGSGNTASGSAALLLNTTGSDNTAAGVDSLFFNTTGSQNTAAGNFALRTNTSGTNNTAVGYFADVSSAGLTNATAIGANAKVNASNKIRLGNGSVTVIEGAVAYTFPSDANLKENFLTVDGEETLEKISEMTLESWNYKGHDPSQFRHYGPTAQEFFAAFGDDGFGTAGTDTTINSGDMAG